MPSPGTRIRVRQDCVFQSVAGVEGTVMAESHTGPYWVVLLDQPNRLRATDIHLSLNEFDILPGCPVRDRREAARAFPPDSVLSRIAVYFESLSGPSVIPDYRIV